MGRMEGLTIALPRAQRDMLQEYADTQGITVGECLRRIIAEKFAQLQRGEETA